MSRILIDSNVLIDVVTNSPDWFAWSSAHLEEATADGSAVINPLILAEISAAFATAEEVERAFPPDQLTRVQLPWEAAFPTARAFVQYRRSGGAKSSPLPDFYIGAHAEASGLSLMTRDVARYRTYFPGVTLICPE